MVIYSYNLGKIFLIKKKEKILKGNISSLDPLVLNSTEYELQLYREYLILRFQLYWIGTSLVEYIFSGNLLSFYHFKGPSQT
jgi:hypothetical protein